MSTLYRARVVRNDSEGVFVEVPDLGEGNEWGPLEMADRVPLALGDPVLVGSINDILEDLALVAKLVTEAYTDPPPPTPYSPPANASFVLYYENAAARNAAITSPTSGATVWLDDEQRLETYTDEGTPGWTQSYAWKNGVLSLPTGSKTGVGVPVPTATLHSASAASTDPLVKASQTGDAQPRLQVGHDGLFQWSSGAAVADSSLQRNGTVLGLTASPRIAVAGDPDTNASYTARQSADRMGVYSVNTHAVGTHTYPHFGSLDSGSPSNVFSQSNVTGDANPRFNSLVNGRLQWGPGNTALDSFLYRNGVNELKTDGNWIVAGNETVSGNLAVTGTMPDGVPRWVVGDGFTAGTTPVGGAGNTETLCLTLPSFTWKAGRIYRVMFTGMVAASVAPNRPLMRIRKTNLAGTELTSSSIPCATTGQTNGHWSGWFKVGASDVTAALAVTIIGSASFTATIQGNSQVNVYDEGLVASRSSNIQTVTVAI